MNLLSVLRIVLRSLLRAPVRSTLTTLGIIIGIAAVITTLAIGSGAKARIEEALSSPTARVITLIAVRRSDDWRNFNKSLSLTDYLQADDYYAIRTTIPGIVASTPQIFSRGVSVQANGRSADSTVNGVDVGGLRIAEREPIAGEYFGPVDVSRAAAVCLISQSLAQELFSNDQAVGRVVRIQGIPFTVIGVVSDRKSSGGPDPLNAQDFHAFVPFTSYLRRIDRSATMTIAVQSGSLETVGVIDRRLINLMEQRRGSRNSEFQTNTAVASINAYVDGSQTMARLLAAIGAISLIVGGIGIMNIMLVNVAERTREIGIRIAIGTRPRDVMGQFLLEASTLSVLGGVVGVGVGLIASSIVTKLNEWPTQVSLSSILTALLCSLAVGIFFGYHPARRAALLDPVEALRTE
jgi:putative ABC transport system permease protein